jgi:DNA-binding NarL/FixJ family response regulator
VGTLGTGVGVRAGAAATGLRASVIARDPETSRCLVAALIAGGVEVPECARDQDIATLLGAHAPSLTDVTVVACDLSRASDMTALRRFRRAHTRARTTVVTPAGHDVGVREALVSGADGVLFADEIDTTLVAVARAVAAGYVCVPRHLRRCAVRPAFSYRERQVLAGVVKGLQNDEIASELFLAESTVKSHLASSFHKLGVRSRKEAAALVLDPAEGLRPLVFQEAPGS